MGKIPNNKYSKAPIQEALIDFQVTPNASLNASSYKKFYKLLESQFEKKGKLFEVTARFQLGAYQNNFSHSQKAHGVRYETPDGKYVLQARDDRFTFSVLNGYEDWDCFRKEAYKAWGFYKEAFKPKKVIREAVKFINRIIIPETSFKLENYFNFYPHVFEDSDDAADINLANFVMQGTLTQAEGGVATVTMFLGLPKNDQTEVMLDIDVVDNLELEIDADEVLQRIEQMRIQKNQIFELSIKDKIRELIK